MKKIMISLYVPSISMEQDVWIPMSFRVGEIIPLLAQSVEELSNGRYVSSDKEVLCWKEANKILALEKTILQYGLQNGDHLVLL